jgi:cyclophilin family peptidyl-prolyl cis-trans isomerase
MNIKNSLITLLLFGIFTLGAFAQKKVKDAPKKNQQIEITTDFGKIKLKLYDETPKHKENFLKLVKEGFYDSTLFHRVIKDFMIQGGDPNSKLALVDAPLGNGENGYTVPAEINPIYFHKKGALAAARLGDEVNPLKNSSGCQFYIVHGRVFTEQELGQIEGQINMQRKQQYFNTWIRLPENKAEFDSLVAYQQAKNNNAFQNLIRQIEPKLNVAYEMAKMDFKFSEEARKAYTTIGGSPHLDGAYTVYGEVTEGIDTIDKIAVVERNRADRPVKDVRMFVKIID